MDKELIELFERVQAIPYKCRTCPSKNLDFSLSYANCNQKRDLLKKVLDSSGFETQKLDAIFNWRDLPIPPDILNILKNSGTSQKHYLLKVNVDGSYLKVDPTWDLGLEPKGFPVTKSWMGDRDTKQITEGEIFFYNPELHKISLPYFREEREEFARAFNIWLGR